MIAVPSQTISKPSTLTAVAGLCEFEQLEKLIKSESDKIGGATAASATLKVQLYNKALEIIQALYQANAVSSVAPNTATAVSSKGEVDIKGIAEQETKNASMAFNLLNRVYIATGLPSIPLARCYEYGIGVQKDNIKAVDLYQNMSEKPNELLKPHEKVAANYIGASSILNSCYIMMQREGIREAGSKLSVIPLEILIEVGSGYKMQGHCNERVMFSMARVYRHNLIKGGDPNLSASATTKCCTNVFAQACSYFKVLIDNALSKSSSSGVLMSSLPKLQHCINALFPNLGLVCLFGKNQDGNDVQILAQKPTPTLEQVGNFHFPFSLVYMLCAVHSGEMVQDPMLGIAVQQPLTAEVPKTNPADAKLLFNFLKVAAECDGTIQSSNGDVCNGDAYFYLGQCYEQGLGVAKNPSQALACYATCLKIKEAYQKNPLQPLSELDSEAVQIVMTALESKQKSSQSKTAVLPQFNSSINTNTAATTEALKSPPSKTSSPSVNH